MGSASRRAWPRPRRRMSRGSPHPASCIGSCAITSRRFGRRRLTSAKGRGCPASSSRSSATSFNAARSAAASRDFRCAGCGFDRLVPFSCHGRAFCPSCGGRRMAERAAHLVDRVFPQVPVRQWVLSLPHRLRYRLGLGSRSMPRCAGVRHARDPRLPPASCAGRGGGRRAERRGDHRAALRGGAQHQHPLSYPRHGMNANVHLRVVVRVQIPVGLILKGTAGPMSCQIDCTVCLYV